MTKKETKSRAQFLYLGAEKRAFGSKTDKQNWFLMIKDISKNTQKGIIHIDIRLLKSQEEAASNMHNRCKTDFKTHYENK